MASKFNIQNLNFSEDRTYKAPVDAMQAIIEKGDAAIDEGLEKATQLEAMLGEIKRNSFDEEYSQEQLKGIENQIETIYERIKENPNEWGSYLGNMNNLRNKVTKSWNSGELYSIRKGHEAMAKLENQAITSKSMDEKDKRIFLDYAKTLYQQNGGAKGEAYKLIPEFLGEIDSAKTNFTMQTAKLGQILEAEQNTSSGYGENGKFLVNSSVKTIERKREKILKQADAIYEKEMAPEIEKRAAYLARINNVENPEEYIQDYVAQQKKDFENFAITSLEKNERHVQTSASYTLAERQKYARTSQKINQGLQPGEKVADLYGDVIKKGDIHSKRNNQLFNVIKESIGADAKEMNSEDLVEYLRENKAQVIEKAAGLIEKNITEEKYSKLKSGITTKELKSQIESLINRQKVYKGVEEGQQNYFNSQLEKDTDAFLFYTANEQLKHDEKMSIKSQTGSFTDYFNDSNAPKLYSLSTPVVEIEKVKMPFVDEKGNIIEIEVDKQNYEAYRKKMADIGDEKIKDKIYQYPAKWDESKFEDNNISIIKSSYRPPLSSQQIKKAFLSVPAVESYSIGGGTLGLLKSLDVYMQGSNGLELTKIYAKTFKKSNKNE